MKRSARRSAGKTCVATSGRGARLVPVEPRRRYLCSPCSGKRQAGERGRAPLGDSIRLSELTLLAFPVWQAHESVDPKVQEMKYPKTKKNELTPAKRTSLDKRLDPRYAAVRLWDWRLCLECGSLIPERCPKCGGNRFSKQPRDILKAAIDQHGYPPSLLK